MSPQEDFTSNDVFPKNLLQSIADNGWTQAQLGQVCGIAQGTISNYLRGKREPTACQLRRLASALGVQMEWLLTGEGPKYPNFILWKNGFILAYWGGFDAVFAADASSDTERAEESTRSSSFARFRFLPENDPNSIPREEQVRFYQRYVSASDEKKRKMLSLGPGTENLFSPRFLNSLGIVMKRQLEETGGTEV